jgi:hypothetical protein
MWGWQKVQLNIHFLIQINFFIYVLGSVHPAGVENGCLILGGV